MSIASMFVPAILLLSQISAQEPASVSRKYAAEESGAYAFSLTGDVPEGQFKATAKVKYKVRKLLESGGAEMQLDLADVKAAIGDMELPIDAGTLISSWDAFGLPQTFPHENAETLYSLLSYCSIVPNKALKTGETLNLDWKNSAKTAGIKGKIKLLEIGETDGLKSAKISVEIEAKSDMDGNPLTLNITSWVETANGKLIKAEGSGSMEGVELKMSVKRA